MVWGVKTEEKYIVTYVNTATYVSLHTMIICKFFFNTIEIFSNRKNMVEISRKYLKVLVFSRRRARGLSNFKTCQVGTNIFKRKVPSLEE